MATSLTGQNVNTTYDALIKVGDNGPITSTPKQLSDGLGNEFPMKASSTEVIITGSLSGSASSAISASYATNALSASYAATASVVTSASYAATASFVQNAISASYATTASVAQQVSATTIATDANYRLLFKSGAATIETAHTDAGIVYNPGLNKLFVDGQISSSNDIIGFSVQGASSVAAGVTLVSLGNANIVGPITASILSASSHIITSYIDFNKTATPAFAEGRVNWIDDTKTLAIDTDVNDIQIEVGHQTVVRVRNESSATILKGRAVYMSGSSGNRPLIYTASYETDPTSASTLGLVAADISNNNNGYVISNGIIRNVNTSMFAAGASLYLSSSGQLTTASIISPLHEVRIGKVITSHATTGIIHIDVDNGYEIGELHDVIDNSTNSTHGALLVKSGSVWKDGYQLTGSYGLTGSLTATSFTGSLNGTASWALNVVGGGGGGGVTINNNTDGNVITATGTANTLDGETNLTFSSSVLTNKVRSNFSANSLVANTSHVFKGYSSADTFAYFLVQDFQGDDTILVEGDLSAGTNTVTIGDVSAAANGTYVQVEDGLSKISLEGKVFAKSIRVPDTALVSQGQFHAGATVADTWSSTGPTLTSGRVVYISGSGQWAEAVASGATTSTGVLGVVTSTANQNEILLHGVVRISQSLAGFTNGSPVYLATSSNGTITQTAPSTVGHVARYVGYVLDSGSRQIYFNPDFTWIEL
jgi:hypothetical protein